MICAQCQHEGPDAPACAACEADPLLRGPAEAYRLDGVLGRGGMGLTYRATRHRDGLTVAIKELPFRAIDRAKHMELFEREARVLRQLNHPGIPAYLDSFIEGQGRNLAYCLVQTLIPGRTLAQEADARRYTEAEVWQVAAEVCDILAYLHGLSPPVIHRDIKPANVMRHADGHLVLIDFGAVRDTLKDTLGGSTVAGTLGFMAPEQLAGQASPASDLYGVGALALSLLSRRDPSSLLDGHRLAWERAVSLSPAGLSLLRALLHPDPAKRPTSARDAAAQARAAAQTPPQPKPTLSAPAPKPKPQPKPTPKPQPAPQPKPTPKPLAARDPRKQMTVKDWLTVSAPLVMIVSFWAVGAWIECSPKTSQPKPASQPSATAQASALTPPARTPDPAPDPDPDPAPDPKREPLRLRRAPGACGSGRPPSQAPYGVELTQAMRDQAAPVLDVIAATQQAHAQGGDPLPPVGCDGRVRALDLATAPVFIDLNGDAESDLLGAFVDGEGARYLEAYDGKTFGKLWQVGPLDRSPRALAFGLVSLPLFEDLLVMEVPGRDALALYHVKRAGALTPAAVGWLPLGGRTDGRRCLSDGSASWFPRLHLGAAGAGGRWLEVAVDAAAQRVDLVQGKGPSGCDDAVRLGVNARPEVRAHGRASAPGEPYDGWPLQVSKYGAAAVAPPEVGHGRAPLVFGLKYAGPAAVPYVPAHVGEVAWQRAASDWGLGVVHVEWAFLTFGGALLLGLASEETAEEATYVGLRVQDGRTLFVVKGPRGAQVLAATDAQVLLRVPDKTRLGSATPDARWGVVSLDVSTRYTPTGDHQTVNLIHLSP